MYAEDEVRKARSVRWKAVTVGYSWQLLSVLDLPQGLSCDNFHEPHVIELPDGRLFGAIRAQDKGIPARLLDIHYRIM